MPSKKNNNSRNRRRGNRASQYRLYSSVPLARQGTASAPPSITGSEQPQTTLRVRDRVETRVLRYMWSLNPIVAGSSVVIGTTIPGLVSVPVGSGAAVSSLITNYPNAQDFLYYRVKAVEVIVTPTFSDTAVPTTYYIAYDPINTPPNTQTFSDLILYSNSAQFIDRDPAQFVYRVKNPSSVNTTTSYSILNGGWIDADALIAAPANTLAGIGPGFIGIASQAGITSSTIRIAVNYLVQFKGKRND